MRPKGAQLTQLYKSAVQPYIDLCGVKWDWNSGEKKRVLKAFILFCEAHDVRDREQLSDMMDKFAKYVKIQSKRWIGWEESHRLNYIGFISRKDDMHLYAAKTKVTKDVGDAATKELAGVKSNDEWDF